MSRVLTPITIIDLQAFTFFLRSEKCFAVGVAVFIHVMVMALLLAGWQENKPVAAKVNTIKVQMVQAPVIAPVTVSVADQLPVEAPPVPPIIEKPPIKKEPLVQAVSEAKIAKEQKEPKVEAVEAIPETTKETEASLTNTPLTEALTVEVTAPPVDAPPTASQLPTDAEAVISTANDTQSNQPFDSSQYFPVKKDAPAYPSRALDKGIQGACTVGYTVNTEGRVENPEVLDGCHPYFIKPSLEATKSFRYTPRIVDGKAVKVPDVKNTFQYRIE